jgi:DNA-binding NarL/FixJ family response regulator
MSKTEPRVLIVEGHDALRVMLFTVLRHQPLGVDTASNAKEALEKVRNCDYALIIVDTDLPDDGAVQFLEAFREERPEASTFVLAVRDPRSEVFLDPDIVSATLSKPIELDVMAEVVRECALVVPPPDDPLPCQQPSESEIRARMERGSYIAN